MSAARALFVLLASLSLPIAACAADAGNMQSLASLWGSDNLYGPLVRDQLVIDGRTPEWRASIAGFNVTVAHGGNNIIFTLPDKQGEFRGRLDGAAHEIVGQWIQPPGITNNNAYATPVMLKPSQERVWQGDVRPLEDRLTLYLEITHVPDGTLNAFIRNPEFNFGHGGPYKITGDIAHLLLGSAPDAEDQITGSYDAAQDLLFIRFPGISQTFDFTRRDRNDALGFYPVTPARSYI